MRDGDDREMMRRRGLVTTNKSMHKADHRANDGGLTMVAARKFKPLISFAF